jgi:hypothetical protein
MQICLSFIKRQSSFLAQERWKTVPWNKVSKTSQDMLLDITVEIAGIAEAAADPSATWIKRTQLQVRVLSLLEQLGIWWTNWNVANPRSAYEVDGGLDTSHLDDLRMVQLLRRTVRFENASHAIELVGYNAALVYLMELAAQLNNRGYAQPTPRPSLPKTFPLSDEEGSTATMPLPPSPLTPPGLVSRLSQPAVEALRIVPYLAHETRVSSPPFIMPIWPLGILYFTWKRLPELRDCLDSVLKDFVWFRTAETELAGARIPGGTARYATVDTSSNPSSLWVGL